MHKHKITPENNCLKILITKTMRLPLETIAKLSNKKSPTQPNRSISLKTKTAITEIKQAKAFNKQITNVTYSTYKINKYTDHKIKNLPTEEILFITTQVQLAISNSKNNNSTGPDDINIRHLKHPGSLTIKYLTNMNKIALNTNTITHLGKGATAISILKSN